MVARVLCILGVIYIHLPPYTNEFPDPFLGAGGLFWFVRHGIGFASVPLLSAIAGYLAARPSPNASQGLQVRRKASSLLLPMILWNCIALCKDMAEHGMLPDPYVANILNQIFALTDFPRVVPLYFLRDLFVCMLLTPLLIRCLKSQELLCLGLLLANAVFNLDGLLLLNSPIILFYSMGLAAASRPAPPDGGARPGFRHGLAVVATVGLSFLAEGLPGESPFAQEIRRSAFIANSLAVAMLFWALSRWLVSTGRAARITCVEPIMFFVFCSHTLAIGLLWALLRRAGVEPWSATYVAFFLVAPLVILAMCMAGGLIMSRLAPGPSRILMGGRFPTFRELSSQSRRLFNRGQDIGRK
ncbi:acyltransferase [Tautonia sp. JC769]|uniref:acyltransferase n=1 Tax=Tautonia sp. JC769 TaxID=3232135 RepID=UPI003457590E